MLENFGKGLKDLKGTASELFENSAYDKLVERVGESGAERAIMHALQERNLTLEKWAHYREVRSVMHSNPLGIKEIAAEIDQLSNASLDLSKDD
jgi:hypothetical protein